MTLDLDALEALEKKATPAENIPFEWVEADQEIRELIPELIRLARIGQRVERDARPGPSQEFAPRAKICTDCGAVFDHNERHSCAP